MGTKLTRELSPDPHTWQLSEDSTTQGRLIVSPSFLISNCCYHGDQVSVCETPAEAGLVLTSRNKHTFLGLHYRYKHSICAYISFTYYIYPNICLNRCCVLYLPVNKMDKRWREGKSLLFNYIHLSLKYRGQSFIRPA